MPGQPRSRGTVQSGLRKPDARGEKQAQAANRPANQRGAARLAAVQALYQMDVGRQSLEDTLAQFNAHHLGREIEGEQYLPADADFFRQIVTGVIKSQLDIDPTIDNALDKGWPMARIDATLRAILRAATFELLRRKDIPAKRRDHRICRRRQGLLSRTTPPASSTACSTPSPSRQSRHDVSRPSPKGRTADGTSSRNPDSRFAGPQHHAVCRAPGDRAGANPGHPHRHWCADRSRDGAQSSAGDAAGHQ